MHRMKARPGGPFEADDGDGETMQTALEFETEETATLLTPCARCGRVSEGGNWVSQDGLEALCDGAYLDGRCDMGAGSQAGGGEFDAPPPVGR